MKTKESKTNKPYWVWCETRSKFFNMNREGRDSNGVVKYYTHIPKD